MTETGDQRERRAEHRERVPAQHIAWARSGAAQTRPGWLDGMAGSSLTFVTPTQDLPAPGELLDLTLGVAETSPRRRRVRVVRAAPYDRYFSVVACMKDLSEALAQTDSATTVSARDGRTASAKF